MTATYNVTSVFNSSHSNTKAPSDSSEQFPVSTAQIIKAVAYVTIMVLSLCGNTLVLIVVKKNIGGQMRSVRNYLLTSMAAIDLVITVGSMPERLTRVLTIDEWLIEGSIGTALCKATNFFEKLSLSVSTLNLVLVAVDRFFAVMFPHRKYFTRRRAFTAIGLIWSLSALYCSPILYYGGLLKEQGKTLCKVRRFFPHWKAWYLLFLVQLLLILALVVVLYASILYKLWRHRKRIGLADSFAVNRAVRENKMKRKVLKMVAVILITFYICFLPYWIGWVFCSYHHSKLTCNDTYIFISIYLSYANSSLNPLIYCAFCESFRHAFKLVIKETCPWISTSSRGVVMHQRVRPRRSALNVLVELSVDSVVKNQSEVEDKEGAMFERMGSDAQEL